MKITKSQLQEMVRKCAVRVLNEAINEAYDGTMQSMQRAAGIPQTKQNTQVKYVLKSFDDVKKVQNFLKEKGYYNGAIDGKCGRGTAQAMVNFMKRVQSQQANKTFADAGDKLRQNAMLKPATGFKPNQIAEAQYGDLVGKYIPTATPVYNEVKTVQQMLQQAGLYNDKIDGKCGQKTAAAMVQFINNAFNTNLQKTSVAPYKN